MEIQKNSEMSRKKEEWHHSKVHSMHKLEVRTLIVYYLNSVGFILSWRHANKEEKAEILQKLQSSQDETVGIAVLCSKDASRLYNKDVR